MASGINAETLTANPSLHEDLRLEAAQIPPNAVGHSDRCAVCPLNVDTYGTPECMNYPDKHSRYFRRKYRDRFSRLQPATARRLCPDILDSPRSCPNCCVCPPCISRVIMYARDGGDRQASGAAWAAKAASDDEDEDDDSIFNSSSSSDGETQRPKKARVEEDDNMDGGQQPCNASPLPLSPKSPPRRSPPRSPPPRSPERAVPRILNRYIDDLKYNAMLDAGLEQENPRAYYVKIGFRTWILLPAMFVDGAVVVHSSNVKAGYEMKTTDFVCVMTAEVEFAHDIARVSLCDAIAAENNPRLKTMIAQVFPPKSRMRTKSSGEYLAERHAALKLMGAGNGSLNDDPLHPTSIYSSVAEAMCAAEEDIAEFACMIDIVQHDFEDDALVCKATKKLYFVLLNRESFFVTVYVTGSGAGASFNCDTCIASCSGTGHRRGCGHIRKVLEACHGIQSEDAQVNEYDDNEEGAAAASAANDHLKCFPVLQTPRPMYLRPGDARLGREGELNHLNMVGIRQMYPLRDMADAGTTRIKLANDKRRCTCDGDEDDDVYTFYKSGVLISSEGPFKLDVYNRSCSKCGDEAPHDGRSRAVTAVYDNTTNPRFPNVIYFDQVLLMEVFKNLAFAARPRAEVHRDLMDRYKLLFFNDLKEQYKKGFMDRDTFNTFINRAMEWHLQVADEMEPTERSKFVTSDNMICQSCSDGDGNPRVFVVDGTAQGLLTAQNKDDEWGWTSTFFNRRQCQKDPASLKGKYAVHCSMSSAELFSGIGRIPELGIGATTGKWKANAQGNREPFDQQLFDELKETTTAIWEQGNMSKKDDLGKALYHAFVDEEGPSLGGNHDQDEKDCVQALLGRMPVPVGPTGFGTAVAAALLALGHTANELVPPWAFALPPMGSWVQHVACAGLGGLPATFENRFCLERREGRRFRQCSDCGKYRARHDDGEPVLTRGRWVCAEGFDKLPDTIDITNDVGAVLRELGPAHHPLPLQTPVSARYGNRAVHYMAYIDTVNAANSTYTLRWHDNDTRNRIVSYDRVTHVYVDRVCDMAEADEGDEAAGPLLRRQYFSDYGLDVFGRRHASRVAIASESRADFVQRVVASAIQPVLEHAQECDAAVLPVTPPLTIAEVLRQCFPPAWRLLSKNGPLGHRLPPFLRPLFATYAKTVTEIMLFSSRVMHEPIKMAGGGYMDCSNVAELRGVVNHIDAGNRAPRVLNSTREELLHFIVALLETEILVPVSREERRASGFIMGPNFRQGTMRCKVHQMDVSNNTVAFHQALRLPRQRVGKARPAPAPVEPHVAGIPANLRRDFNVQQGDLKSCHKTVNSPGPYTGDLTIVACACRGAHSKILGAGFMDAGESPRNVVDYLDTLQEPPEVVFYDNSCHLALMLMSRNSHRYYKTIVLSDNFHVKNHTACSVLISPKQWDHLDVVHEANTEAAEQANAELDKHLSRFLSFCKARNALNILEMYITIMNAK